MGKFSSPSARYSVRIGESYCIAQDATYDALLTRIMDFTARAALARCVDDYEWEHDQLRRKGLAALQIVRNGKAIWDDGRSFEAELSEASRQNIDARFKASNELDLKLYRKLDRDLRERWRRAGYATSSLLGDMKRLFGELEREASDRASDARDTLLEDLRRAQMQESP